ncbi:MAG: hypothetical protein KatS3mg077_3369 [Candidatus Binatia bacterium]|nr:MAG: hypothetical protein KatS3mg077_3369 [Candidatus Binatia bacterium]
MSRDEGANVGKQTSVASEPQREFDVTAWAECLQSRLRPPDPQTVETSPLLELLVWAGPQSNESADELRVAGAVAQACRQEPLNMGWVAFYRRQAHELYLIAQQGNPPPVKLPSVVRWGKHSERLADSQGQLAGPSLPWLPLDAFTSSAATKVDNQVWALPLLAFGEVNGLLCAQVEDAQRCSGVESIVRLVCASMPLAVLMFVRRRCSFLMSPFSEVAVEEAASSGDPGKLLLRRGVGQHSLFPELVGQSRAFLHALSLAQRWAVGRAPILITGETGTGKELLARAIYALSERRNGPWVAVNCPAIPRELAESELFGHEKGAFTGATEARIGRFERAEGGVLFLDEVGDLPHAIQAKLLRVLQEGEIERVGSAKTKKVDVRVIAATNRDLEEAVRQGEFRKDLFHRLAALPIHLPPLRERTGDIEILAWHFLRISRERYGKRIDGMAPGVMERLLEHDWPGNVRELEYVIERAVLLATEPWIRMDDVADLRVGEGPAPGTGSLHSQLRAEKVRRVEHSLRQAQGNCAEAARLLGMTRGNFSRLLRSLGIDPRRYRSE